ncbi:YciI family protein [Larkinella soli]|uniref:YciI family protein n=1 Tax=Larkinella soli TaxID=1770527 RepID=UPI000FFC1FC0|nr:YciI family protein [Larkinella soli]
MEKFMLVFHSSNSAELEFNQKSPEQIQAEIEKWNQWIGGIAAQGKLIGTEALLPSGKVMTEGGKVVTDGPYTEGKEIVGGYLVMTAESFDEAVSLAHGCPHFEGPGNSVEVRQIMNFA